MNYKRPNERIKRQYFQYLEQARRHEVSTVDAVAKALSRFEEYTRYKDFKKFHIQHAVAFKAHLVSQTNSRTGQKISKSTVNSTLGILKRFFQWLSDKPGYKSRISYTDADYFTPSEKELRAARNTRPKAVPTLKQVTRVIHNMPVDSDIALRNRSLLAFTILTGARDNAIASLSLKHIDLNRGCVFQDAREVRTKFRKSFMTYFFPVGDDILRIVEDWVYHLRNELHWCDDAPLFPATRNCIGENNLFGADGLKRQHWSNASPIRKIFKEAFHEAGLQYFNPHSFRNTLVALGQEICKSPRDFKAWSQNLGHEKVLTTFLSYGEVPDSQQAEIISGMTHSQEATNPEYEQIVEITMRKLMDEHRFNGMGKS